MYVYCGGRHHDPGGSHRQGARSRTVTIREWKIPPPDRRPIEVVGPSAPGLPGSPFFPGIACIVVVRVAAVLKVSINAERRSLVPAGNARETARARGKSFTQRAHAHENLERGRGDRTIGPIGEIDAESGRQRVKGRGDITPQAAAYQGQLNRDLYGRVCFTGRVIPDKAKLQAMRGQICA